MPWNQPGNGNNDKDPWGNRKKQDGPPDLEEIVKKIGAFFGGGKSGGSKRKGSNKGFVSVVIVAIVAIWGASGFYTVDEKQSGVILQFGQFDRIVGAGLVWVPRGIEKLIKVDVNQLHQTRISDVMLTKDTNMIHVELGIQYRINNARDYLFNLTTPDDVVRQAGEAALRKVIGDSFVDDVLTKEKEKIRKETELELIAILDEYAAGVTISTVTLEDASPPPAVTDSFNEVNRAREEADRMIQQANQYHNKNVPLAEAKRQKMINEAEGYKAKVVAEANGEVARFNKLLPQYKAAEKVTRQRLYLEAVEEVMSNTSKIMVDVKGGNSMLYLPLQELMKKQNSKKAGE